MRSWHVTWSSEGRHPLAPDEGRRRKLVRAIARIAGESTSLFCVVDDHVHVVLFCEDAAKGRLVQALGFAFRPLVAVKLTAPFVRPVRDRSHMEWLADEYILGQPVKHGLATHPALWAGSCFADLVGARVLPGLKLRITDALPRWRLRAAYRAVGLPETKLDPVSDTDLRMLGASRIAAVAAFATAADPDLRGGRAPEVLARRVTAALGAAAGIAGSEIAWALHITGIAAARLRKRDAPKPVLAAARKRLALEVAVATGPRTVPGERSEPELP